MTQKRLSFSFFPVAINESKEEPLRLDHILQMCLIYQRYTFECLEFKESAVVTMGNRARNDLAVKLNALGMEYEKPDYHSIVISNSQSLLQLRRLIKRIEDAVGMLKTFQNDITQNKNAEGKLSIVIESSEKRLAFIEQFLEVFPVTLRLNEITNGILLDSAEHSSAIGSWIEAVYESLNEMAISKNAIVI